MNEHQNDTPAEGFDPDAQCRDCGAPFNNANPSSSGRCPACEA